MATGLRLKQIDILHVRIPLRTRVAHASHARDLTDSILVRAELADGQTGWGEGLPRDYVTGETIETAWSQLTSLPLEELATPWNNITGLTELVSRIDLSDARSPCSGFGNAARCALELSLLDAGTRSLGVSLSEFIHTLFPEAPIHQSRERVRYSGAITGSKLRKACRRAWMFRLAGFRECKLKVGLPGQDDVAWVKALRARLGSRMQLRIDANEAWKADAIPELWDRLRPWNVVMVEQPLPDAENLELASLRRKTGMPVMLDESLCTVADGRRAIERELCDAFNIRLSKCGGVVPAVELAALAQQAGLQYQLGCQVGETGILSAAGRHFAASIAGLFAVEGSFDRFLVRERLTREDLTFGWGGMAPALRGPGLGINIDAAAVQRVTVRSQRRTVP